MVATEDPQSNGMLKKRLLITYFKHDRKCLYDYSCHDKLLTVTMQDTIDKIMILSREISKLHRGTSLYILVYDKKGFVKSFLMNCK